MLAIILGIIGVGTIVSFGYSLMVKLTLKDVYEPVKEVMNKQKRG